MVSHVDRHETIDDIAVDRFTCILYVRRINTQVLFLVNTGIDVQGSLLNMSSESIS